MVRRLLALAGATLLLSLLSAGVASATNTRVSIANYAWSNKAVHIDLGEKVTWDWLGPDTAHSVTGISENDLGWDSDPKTDAPSHQPGDSFTLQFNSPGTYLFQCKLHAVVRGEVIVSDGGQWLGKGALELLGGLEIAKRARAKEGTNA